MPVTSWGRTRIVRTPLAIALFGLLTPFGGCAQVSPLVTAEAISGIVVETATGRPVENSVAVVRFVRFNAGHQGVHCFRSMAIKTDAAGRFRFSRWRQENTQADSAVGLITAYKARFSVPQSVRVDSSSGAASRDTIAIPAATVRLTLERATGSEEDRIQELGRLVGNFACRLRAQSDDKSLLLSVRDEIASYPLAQQRPKG